VKCKEERKRNEKRARKTQVPSGGRNTTCGMSEGDLRKFVNSDDNRPHVEGEKDLGEQIIYFVLDVYRET
jgi:hypothetical protein